MRDETSMRDEGMMKLGWMNVSIMVMALVNRNGANSNNQLTYK
jgi:hypothetical protein